MAPPSFATSRRQALRSFGGPATLRRNTIGPKSETRGCIPDPRMSDSKERLVVVAAAVRSLRGERCPEGVQGSTREAFISMSVSQTIGRPARMRIACRLLGQGRRESSAVSSSLSTVEAGRRATLQAVSTVARVTVAGVTSTRPERERQSTGTDVAVLRKSFSHSSMLHISF